MSQYVLDNYDTIGEIGKSKAYTEPSNDGSGINTKARSVRIDKRINGTYHVVEAVLDTRQKTVFINTA